MRVLEGRNVNDLYVEGLSELRSAGRQSQSRAGDVIVAPYPVVSVYDRPVERVLFNAERDANPFFHLMEGLWMLAGRDDAAFLDHYVRDFSERFSEECGHVHGAYGRRWRSSLGFDQLDVVIKKLRENPLDRQCVIQMWDATLTSGDFAFGHDDLEGDWRDRPCNTHAYLRVRQLSASEGFEYLGNVPVSHAASALDLTVCCRSNDVVWGAYGANAVHFSMLHEYLAGRIGVAVGRMYQVSNNFHGYVEMLDKVGEPPSFDDPYENGEVHSIAMGCDWESWDEDLRVFMMWHERQWQKPSTHSLQLINGWFSDVAVHVAEANRLWRTGGSVNKRLAMEHATNIQAPDWRRACVEWMGRRAK